MFTYCFPFIMEYNGLKILIAKPNSAVGVLVKPPRKTQPLTENKVTCVFQGQGAPR